MIRVISLPHGLDKYFLVSKLTINLTDIKSSNLVLGHSFTTLTEKQKGIKNTINSVIVEKDNLKKEISETREKVIAIDEVVAGIQSDYVIQEEIQGRCLLKENVKTLNALGAIENAETGDIHKVLSNSKYYIYIDSTWMELVSKTEINSLKTQFNNLNTQLDDLITRVETLEGGGN